MSDAARVQCTLYADELLPDPCGFPCSPLHILPDDILSPSLPSPGGTTCELGSIFAPSQESANAALADLREWYHQYDEDGIGGVHSQSPLSETSVLVTPPGYYDRPQDYSLLSLDGATRRKLEDAFADTVPQSGFVPVHLHPRAAAASNIHIYVVSSPSKFNIRAARSTTSYSVQPTGPTLAPRGHRVAAWSYTF